MSGCHTSSRDRTLSALIISIACHCLPSQERKEEEKMGLRSSRPAKPRLQKDDRGRNIQPQSQGFGNWRQRMSHRHDPSITPSVPRIPHFPADRHTLLRLDRVHDWAALEEELCRRLHVEDHLTDPMQGTKITQHDRMLVEKLTSSRLLVANLEDVVDDQHCIVSLARGQIVWYAPLLSIVDRSLLHPNAQVLVSLFGFAVVGVLDDMTGNEATNLIVEACPLETFADIGGLDQQIQEIREVIEMPLTRPELYEDMGIIPPKGVLLYGPPGTGKTLLARAVASASKATFINVSGSQLVRKTMGSGPKLVRKIFEIAVTKAPSIVFIDEIDAIGGKRVEGRVSDGEKEVQRTMLELLSQLDGFDRHNDVKIIMATNRIDCLDPALIRPGRIDRKIEIPLPDLKGKKAVFEVHTKGMKLDPQIQFESLLLDHDDLSPADIKSICSEAGIMALRDMRKYITREDFDKAKKTVLITRKDTRPVLACMFN